MICYFTYQCTALYHKLSAASNVSLISMTTKNHLIHTLKRTIGHKSIFVSKCYLFECIFLYKLLNSTKWFVWGNRQSKITIYWVKNISMILKATINLNIKQQFLPKIWLFITVVTFYNECNLWCFICDKA